MRRHTTAATRRWQATLIFTVFGAAVLAAAGAGWWYARESTPHQGPVLLISIEGLRPADLQAYEGTVSRMPAIDALSAEAVVFERAYAHSPLTLPAHASLLAGQLPFEHGVRDEAGFTLDDDAQSMAELLRNRGFDTGAAVSSFLLRPESGVAQGFSFFDAELPDDPGEGGPVVARDGVRTSEAAERWLRARRGHRFFLFVQVAAEAADPTVARLVAELEERNLYDQATIVVTADHGDAGAALSLDEDALHVPLLVKQPRGKGAGRRVTIPVQHIDLLPTILDLVRAPVPSDLRGRSLRAVLDGDERALAEPRVYAESLAPRFRFGGAARFALAKADERHVRSGETADSVLPGRLKPAATDAVSGFSRTSSAEAERSIELGEELDRLLDEHETPLPEEIPAAHEDRFAMLGYLGGSMLAGGGPAPLDPDDEAQVADAHRAAAALAGRKQYAAAISQLREIVRAHPRLPVVQYQLAMLLERVGRREEAERALRATATVEPGNPYVPMARARLRLRAGRAEAAREPAALAVALAERLDSRARAAAHRIAARVALAVEDAATAQAHAEAAAREDPRVPMEPFVRGRLLYADGRYDEARAAFEAAAARLQESGGALEELHLSLGETLARLERFGEAEEQFRAELRAFPRSLRAYSSLALLLRASNRASAVEEVLEALVDATQTPDGYETAARLWTILREPARAAELRAEARARFRR
ncbi:MAG: sulfatase [Acidobacteria bacterium]|nr:sulfatase [Acidobacteriota bacterium]